MRSFSTADTIVAVATPPADGAIGIVRLSGPESLSYLRRVFRTQRPPAWRSHQLYYGHVVDPETEQSVDEVLAVYMQAPRTYTREDMVEVHGHGGAATIRLVVAAFTRLGARPAERGEFTLRAFLNGRLDLAQAEAVASVVSARTDAGVQQALGQLAGRLSREVEGIRGLLVGALARIEAVLDFAEDDVPLPSRDDLAKTIGAADARLEALLQTASRGVLVHEGARVVLVGLPNAGKSSLLNALLQADRAIVTPIPGTTRDVLTEVMDLGGIPVTLVDTAGVTDTDDEVERLGIARTRQELAQADAVILVIDRAVPPSREERLIAAEVGNRPCVVVLNKADLPARYPEAAARMLVPSATLCVASATTGQGLADVRATLQAVLTPTVGANGAAPLLGNMRHVAALRQAAAQLEAAQETLASHYPLDMVTVDLRGAIDALGEITGQTVTEDLLDQIFSTFCIGK